MWTITQSLTMALLECDPISPPTACIPRYRVTSSWIRWQTPQSAPPSGGKHNAKLIALGCSSILSDQPLAPASDNTRLRHNTNRLYGPQLKELLMFTVPHPNCRRAAAA